MKKVFLILLTCLIASTGVAAQKADEFGVVIDKRPFQELNEQIRKKLSDKQLDLSKPFAITVTGKLTKESKLDDKRTKIETAEGSDPEMAQIAVAAIQTLSDAGYFKYLSNLGATGGVVFKLGQDAEKVSSDIALEMETEEKAKTMASTLRSLFQAANQMIGPGDPSALLSKNALISANGKTMHMEFSAPARIVAELIEKKVKNSTAPKQ